MSVSAHRGRQSGIKTERHRQAERQTDTKAWGWRENSNSKALFYKDCSLGSVKRERRRETERQTHRGRATERAESKLQALVYDILPLEEGAGKQCRECGLSLVLSVWLYVGFDLRSK